MDWCDPAHCYSLKFNRKWEAYILSLLKHPKGVDRSIGRIMVSVSASIKSKDVSYSAGSPLQSPALCFPESFGHGGVRRNRREVGREKEIMDLPKAHSESL